MSGWYSSLRLRNVGCAWPTPCVTWQATFPSSLPVGLPTAHTGTAVFSRSVNPERIVISTSRESSLYPLLREHGLFGPNVLSADQQHVADRFAGRGGVKGEERYQAPNGRSRRAG